MIRLVWLLFTALLLECSLAQNIQPPSDKCVDEPCVYPFRSERLKPHQPIYFQLNRVDTADHITCNISNVHCSRRPCDGLNILFLTPKQFKKLQAGASIEPEPGSFVNSSASIDDGLLTETDVFGRHRNFYVALLNRGSEDLIVDVTITYRVADCLLYLTAMLALPLLLLFLCMFICRRKNYTAPNYREEFAEGHMRDDDPLRIRNDEFDKEAHGGEGDEAIRGSADDREDERQDILGQCCHYNVDKDGGAPDLEACCGRCCKLPRWDCFGGYPMRLWQKPEVGYSLWWRQYFLLTWPWNPEYDEVLPFRSRQIFVLIVLVFNLLALTLWNEALMQLKGEVGQWVPMFDDYLSRYVGSAVFSSLFYITFKPLLTFAVVVSPQWRRSSSKLKRVLGRVLRWSLQILFVLLVFAASMSMITLFSQYRCSVLIYSLVIPYFVYEIMKMVFIMGFIPLPVWYLFICAFGPEPDPNQPCYSPHPNHHHDHPNQSPSLSYQSPSRHQRFSPQAGDDSEFAALVSPESKR